MNSSMSAHSNENWPNGGATYVYPLVMIVGPPGAVYCGLPGPHRAGVPYMGSLDENRTTTIGLPSIYDRRNYSTTVRYQCLVRTEEHPEGEIVYRDVPNIEYPTDPEARAARHRSQIELRQNWCNNQGRFGSLFPCDTNVAYSPARSFQPKMIHVGEPDAEAPARWARLRAEFLARCNEPARVWMCREYDDAAWRDMERVDLGLAPEE